MAGLAGWLTVAAGRVPGWRWAGFSRRLAVIAAAMLAASVAIPVPASAASSSVAAWGYNLFGEMGNGTVSSGNALPVGGSGLSGVTAMAAGRYHTLALLSDGTVEAWGANEAGQLGIGTNSGPEVCLPAPGPCSTVPVAVAGLSNVKAISAGEDHSLALLQDGTVKAWGANYYGQLGDGTKTGPQQCEVPGSEKGELWGCSTTPVTVSDLSGVTAISASGGHNLALLGDGTVEEWGYGDTAPHVVNGLNGVTAIAAGDGFGLALLSDGTVQAWGDDLYGELGSGAIGAGAPRAVSGLTGVTAISAGRWHSLALLSNGTVEAWGQNLFGQLGTGTTTGPERCDTGEGRTTPCAKTPVAIGGLAGVTAISAASGEHSLALLNNGTMDAWGSDTDGQLGDGTFTGPEQCEGNIPCASTPVPVSPLGGVTGIATGLADSYALVNEPTVTSVSPMVGAEAGGTSVTITGLALTGTTTVKFGSADATSFTVDSETSITAVAPAGVGTVDLTVATPGGTSVTNSGDKFRYAPEPVVTSVNPNEGPTGSGTAVTITGAHLGGATAVRFGSLTASSLTVNSEESITVTSPTAEGGGTVDVTVTTPSGTSAMGRDDRFTYVPLPHVELVTPSQGPPAGGTSVTITGADLGGASEVLFGDAPASSYSVNSDGSITAVSPAGSGAVDVSVTTPGGTSPTEAHDRFTYASEGAGAVEGAVTDGGSAHTAVANALVSVCSSSMCYSAETRSDGSYSIAGVAEGEYVASVSPSQASGDEPATSTPFLVTQGATATENFSLTYPTPPPPGTVVTGFGESSAGGSDVPVINWSVESPITTRACAGGTVSATISAENIWTGAQETVGPVTLTESLSELGTFTGSLPVVYPLHGTGTVTITVAGCPTPSEDNTVAFTIYIDPSGTVVDANNENAPLAGASVTLLSSTSLTGPFSPVPTGSAVMSPANRVNPDTSRSNGAFGWDTVAGFFEVRASKPGCGTTTTQPFQVPPAISNLQIALHCVPGFHVEITALPAAKRTASYTAQLEAYGGTPPYKWRKTAKLPKGLKLSKTGLLSGTPSKKLTPGSYPVAVQVQDASKRKVTATLELELT